MSRIRVLSYGGSWAGRVAAMLLAEQGADIIEIDAPSHRTRPEDALLGRCKRSVTMDLSSISGREDALGLARDCDIIIDNLGPGRAERFGIDYEAVRADNDTVVYVSVPAFASRSPRGQEPAWEGTIAAGLGVYTDLHMAGALLGGRPKFTALPMASAYGGIHAAIAASMGFLHRLRSGRGQIIEVPLADALMSAMTLLIMDIEGQPARFGIPPIDRAMRDVAFPILRDLSGNLMPHHAKMLETYLMAFGSPTLALYPGSDGALLFVNAGEHVHQSRAFLETLGVFDELVADGLVVASPYEEGDGENQLNRSSLSLEWKVRLKTVIAERLSTRPAAEWEKILSRAGVPSAVVQTAREWLNDPAAMEGGNVVALDDARFGTVRQPGRFLSIDGPENLASAPLSPSRVEDHPAWRSARITAPEPIASASGAVLENIRVLDLSNTIAGPAAARVLAEFGADVVRVDAPAPIAGPRHTMWFGVDVNQGKKAMILDLKRQEGRDVLHRMVAGSDVLIGNFLDGASRRMGIAPDQLRAANPDIISCQLTAWAGPEGGPRRDDPGYDPVIQYAVGITARYGSAENPVLHGLASCIDYTTGFLTALGVAQALVARELGRGAAHVQTSLCMGGQLIQFPFMVDGAGPLDEPSGQQTPGYGPHQRLYEAADGWVYVGIREADGDRVGKAFGTTMSGLADRLKGFTSVEIAERLRPFPAASCVRVTRLEEVRRSVETTRPEESPAFGQPQGLVMAKGPHPSGYPVSLPLPSWYRASLTPVRRLGPAPLPGADTGAALASYGFGKDEIADLARRSVTGTGWSVLKHYLPRGR